MLTATEPTFCATCRCRLLDSLDEMVCPRCGRVEKKDVAPEVRPGREPRAVEVTSSALGGFMGGPDSSYGERFPKGFSNSGSTYSYLKTLSDHSGRGGHDYKCALLIERACEKLSVPSAVPQNAVEIAKRVLASDELPTLARRPSMPSISAFSIVAACKLTGQRNVSWRQVVSVFQDQGHRVKSSTLLKLGLLSPVRVNPTPAADYVQPLLLQVRDDPRIRSASQNKEYFAKLCATTKSLVMMVKPIQGGHNPRGLAATAIYAAEVRLARSAGRKKMLTQRMVAELVSLAEYTIREQYEELFRDLPEQC